LDEIENQNNLGIIISNPKVINVEGGNVLHALKVSDESFKFFGEAYFSEVNLNSVKAWKMHTKMTLNLLVPIGKVKFVFTDSIENSNFFEVIIGENRYKRITVPPNIWFGFKGVGKEKNLILNIADIEHDTNEVMRKTLSDFKYNW
jgi:dTDP-4-dehydrorhamnose 3,5-epimerase